MDATPLWTSHWLIVVHACTALAAIAIGAIQFLCKKGTANHRLLGYVWVTLILIVCLSSFGIFGIRLLGPFSPIHLLSILSIVSVGQAMVAIRSGNVVLHKKIMVRLYALALLLTGAFTLYPGRVMHQVMFG
ncbi:MAG: DUF2306 domain-containing protein [Granulosicoccus sp.]